mgnify:CR=1 FL=1
MAYTAGEFFPGARIEQVTAWGAAIVKGEVLTLTPTSTLPRAAKCDASGNAPYAVAIEAIDSSGNGRAVVYGPVAVTADENCYRGAIVGGKTGKVIVVAKPFAAGPCPLGKMIVGAANTTVGVVFLGQVI